MDSHITDNQTTRNETATDRASGHGAAAERLLCAAERLFAEKGFEGTSIRDITNEAGCNVAAVNYHFGGKDRLYQEMFRRRLRQLLHIRLEAIESVTSKGSAATMEDLLRAFCRAFIDPLVDSDDSRVIMNLFCREMYQRHLPLEMFIDEMVRPVQKHLGEAICLVCPAIRPESIIPCIHSVIGQLVHVIRVKEMFPNPDQPEVAHVTTDRMIEHIVKFSVAGIDAYTKTDINIDTGKGQ